MYVMFDESGNQEYGFIVEEGMGWPRKQFRIKEFIKMCDKDINTIVLPKLVNDEEIRYEENKYDFKKLDNFTIGSLYNNYVDGRVMLSCGCFKNVKNATIVVPFNSSVMIDSGSFDKDANIELILHKDLDLKIVRKTFDMVVDYGFEIFTLIGDKKLKGNFAFGKDDYDVADYNYEKNYYNHIVANFKVSRFSDFVNRKDNGLGK